jgi:hypothetical protein
MDKDRFGARPLNFENFCKKITFIGTLLTLTPKHFLEEKLNGA